MNPENRIYSVTTLSRPFQLLQLQSLSLFIQMIFIEYCFLFS